MNENEKLIRDRFTFFVSYYNVIKKLSTAQKACFLDAICCYMFFDDEPDFKDDVVLAIGWEGILPNLESTRRKIDGGRKGGSKNKHNESKREEAEQCLNNMNQATDVERNGNIDWVSLADFWDTSMEGKVIQKVKVIDEYEKSAVKAIMSKYGKESIAIAIKKAAESSFMNGDNDKNWIASFDWVFKPKNFPKVLKGNYDNNGRTEAVQEYDDKLYHPDLPENFRPLW